MSSPPAPASATEPPVNNDDASAPVIIRLATRDDMHHVYEMIHELAQYEGMPTGPQLTVQDLVRDGFECSPAWFFCLLAECGGRVVGHALCSRAYSSWTRRAFYIEDLYVRPQHRKLGVGRKLLARLCHMAVQEGVQRVDWHVLESNAPARGFYARVGARDLRLTEGRTAMRLDAEPIRRLAQESDTTA